jgi:hypothetical protein
MGTEARWVAIAEYGVIWEAEFAMNLLRDAGIPGLVRGAEPGIFGPGFAGAGPRGVTLYVLAEHVDEAMDLLAMHEGDTLEEEDDEGEPEHVDDKGDDTWDA